MSLGDSSVSYDGYLISKKNEMNTPLSAQNCIMRNARPSKYDHLDTLRLLLNMLVGSRADGNAAVLRVKSQGSR